MKAALIQLRAELVAQADELARASEPDEARACVFAAEEQADRLAAQFASNDLALAREACAEVASVLWPDAGLPVDHWWRSPLGRVMARTFETDDTEPVNQKVAAVMLGVHRGTVARLVSVGVLERHPQGGIRRSSVLRYNARTS